MSTPSKDRLCAETVTPEWADGDEMPCNVTATASRNAPSGYLYPVCDDHKAPSLIACHIDESAGMDPAFRQYEGTPAEPLDLADHVLVIGAPGSATNGHQDGDEVAVVPLVQGDQPTPVLGSPEWDVMVRENFRPIRESGATVEEFAEVARTIAQAGMEAPPSLTLGARIRLAADGPDVPSSTRAVLELLATDADTLTRVGERLVAAAQERPATPAVGVRTSEGATGAPGGAGEVGLGDALRAYDGPMWYAHPQLAALADRADALERERGAAVRDFQDVGRANLKMAAILAAARTLAVAWGMDANDFADDGKRYDLARDHVEALHKVLDGGTQ